MTRMVRAAAVRYPRQGTLWHSGTRLDLIREINRLLSRAERLSNARNRLNARRTRLRHRHFFQDWRDALAQGQVGLTEESVDFERQVFARFEGRHGRRANFQAVMKYMFLRRLLRVTRRDRALARRFSIYYNRRDESMYDWARDSGDPVLARTAGELRKLERRIQAYNQEIWDLKEQSGLTRRILLMRNQFGALVALGFMKDSRALKDLRGLAECESTPYLKRSPSAGPSAAPLKGR